MQKNKGNISSLHEKHCEELGLWLDTSLMEWASKDLINALKNKNYWGGVFGSEANTVTGFYLCRSVAGETELIYIATSPDSRGCGIANLLVEDMLTKAKNKNGQKIHLEVREGNETAVRLYKKFGFVQTGIRKDYYSSLNDNKDNGKALAKENALLFNLDLIDLTSN